MSQMDDILSEQDKDAASQIGHAMQSHGVTPAPNNDNILPELVSNDNEAPELYRSVNSDVGNMNKNEIPESVKQQAVNATQIDLIEVQQEANEVISPSSTPVVERANDVIER